MASPSEASVLLRNELKDFCTNPIDGFSAWEVDENNIFQWNVTFFGLRDTPFIHVGNIMSFCDVFVTTHHSKPCSLVQSEGNVFHAIISFPQNYPYSPPTVRFLSEIIHPDVLPDGEVSGSIFRPPANGRKLAAGRLSPPQTVENIVLSILSMLSSPIDESPAKLEAVVPTERKTEEPPECPRTEEESPQVSSYYPACSNKDGHHFELKSLKKQCESQQVILDLLAPSKNIVCCNKNEHYFELRSFDKQFSCDGCKQQGSGPRYKCLYCNYELHEECRFPKATAFHDYFGDLEFRFFDKPQVLGRCCNACGKGILGFNYHSIDKKWDLHPCCIKLLKKLVIEETLFDLHKNISSKCIWCQEKKISGGSIPGWGYASRCGDYNFHVHCLMEMLHTNASINDGNLKKIDLQHVAQKSKKKGKKGWSAFSRIVKIFLTKVLPILLGDPTIFLATALVELFFNG